MTMTLHHRISFPLHYPGECSLIGFTPADATLYVEEIHGEQGWAAHTLYGLDGRIVHTIDESSGDTDPLPLPAESIKPDRVWQTMALNFSGPRHQGLRVLERIDDTVRPLTLPEKMKLAAHLRLAVPAPVLLGLAESYILTEALIEPPALYVVCRRLRIAHALPQRIRDAEGNEYDYVTHVLHVAHIVDLNDEHEIALSDMLDDFGGVTLHHPVDCLYHDGLLIIVENGSTADARPGHVHLWQVAGATPPADPIQSLKKRLYE